MEAACDFFIEQDIQHWVQDVRIKANRDRVFVAALLAKRNTGTYAQKVVCDETAVHRLPESISFEKGASLGIPALTAYRALFHRAKMKPGETVLIRGASGGVGLLAVQMAKGLGATVIGTASTEEGKSLVKASGATHVLDHITEASIDKIMSLIHERGPDFMKKISKRSKRRFN